ncbi:hypothetical protein BDQ17DRAFT_1348887 [Cyathus striatus]|nr:hypothetical protein BDQ17DRAFT_1348887 [Cyathus striatus]
MHLVTKEQAVCQSATLLVYIIFLACCSLSQKPCCHALLASIPDDPWTRLLLSIYFMLNPDLRSLCCFSDDNPPSNRLFVARLQGPTAVDDAPHSATPEYSARRNTYVEIEWQM